MELQSFITTLLASSAVSGALATAIIWTGRTWISERLRQSIQHEYDQKMAYLNSELKSESEKKSILFKTSFEKEAERLRFATSSIGAAQQLAIERKLNALENLWEAILEARKNVPLVMGFLDILTVEEYKSSKDNPSFQQLVGQISIENLATMFKDNVGSRERIRPYVGEYLWALLSTYQALIARVALLLHWGTKDEEKLNWHKDKGVLQLIRIFLNAEEYAEFEAVRVGKIGWLQSNLENKILSGIDAIVSGRQIADQALEQARFLEQKVRELNAEAVALQG